MKVQDNLLDQMIDNNKKAKNNRYVVPHPNNEKNYIPTLVNSDGTHEPVIHPNALAKGYGAQGYVGTNVDSLGNPTGGSMVESKVMEASQEEITIEIMKDNLNYLRAHSNEIFKNLKLNCEWDSTVTLIHILVEFKDEVLDMDPKGDNLYPYPLDIVIPYDSSPVIIYNSKKSPYTPDYSTSATEEDSPLRSSNWASENDDTNLTMVLREILSPLDDGLDHYNESLLESNEDSFILVDEIEDYQWFMNQSQTSIFYKGDEIISEEPDLDIAQQFWDSIESKINKL